MEPGSRRVMILSDTHGSLPDAVLRACEGADHIIHAGDAGADEILMALGAIAPVTAVCGNVDRRDIAPMRARVQVGRWRILVQHIVWAGDSPSGEVRDLLSGENADLLVFGHTHQPLCRQEGGVVFFNPGSCGPKRFSLPQSYAEAILGTEEGRFRIFGLEGAAPKAVIFEGKFHLAGSG